MSTTLRLIATHPVVAAALLYALLGFYTFGYAMNHFCDGKSMEPRGRLVSKYEWCQITVGMGAFGAGVGWPIYWTGKFFIWWHEPEPPQ